jgi:hypothetical protein
MSKFKTIIRSATVLTVALSASMATAQSQYPGVTRAQSFETLIRPCTQLERDAGITAEKCGAMRLSEVVKALFEATSD